MSPLNIVACEEALQQFEKMIGYSQKTLSTSTPSIQTPQPQRRETEGIQIKNQKQTSHTQKEEETIDINTILRDIQRADGIVFEYREREGEWLVIELDIGENKVRYHLTPENLQNTDYGKLFDELIKMISEYHKNGLISDDYYMGLVRDLNDFRENVYLYNFNLRSR